MLCKVLDFFATSGGEIYIIDFPRLPFAPNFGLRLKYLDTIFEIGYLSVGSHYYYDRAGLLYKNQVWSCGLKLINKINNIRIPNGTELIILSEPN